MIQLVLDDTLIHPHLFPFTLTRAAADIRIGILTIREKWTRLLGHPVLVNRADDYLQSPAMEGAVTPVVFSGNIVPSAAFVKELLSGTYSKEAFLQQSSVRILHHPWDIFAYNGWAIKEDFALVTA